MVMYRQMQKCCWVRNPKNESLSQISAMPFAAIVLNFFVKIKLENNIKPKVTERIFSLSKVYFHSYVMDVVSEINKRYVTWK